MSMDIPSPAPEQRLLLGSKWLVLTALFLVFLGAAALRAYIAANDPAEFQFVRQYHGALMTRAIYYQDQKQPPEWKREVIAHTTPRVHEPPILEWLSAKGYGLAGTEALWIPRLLNSAFWLLGGVFLYLLLRRWYDPETGLLCTAFYLLLPYSVRMSLSFQPDTMMLMATLAALYAIACYHARPSVGRLVAAALAAALALLIKPFAIFAIGCAYIALGLTRMPLRRLLVDGRSWLLALVAVTPAGVFHIHQALTETTLDRFVGKSISPALLTSPEFYMNWLYRLEQVVGFPVLVLAAIGTLMIVRRAPRALTWGLWLGYLLFGLVFTFMFATHTYYHIGFIPLAALGLAPLAERILDGLRAQPRWLVAPAFIAILGFLLAVTEMPLVNETLRYDHEGIVAKYRAIGDKVHHGVHNIALSEHENEPLMFYGWLSSASWPGAWTQRIERGGNNAVVTGVSNTPTGAVSKGRSAKLRYEEDFLPDAPEYFIVTDFEQYHAQPDLMEFLDHNFPLLAEDDEYLIFDLRAGARTDTDSGAATTPAGP